MGAPVNRKPLDERFKALLDAVKTDEFLSGRGMGNEFNIHIFCHDAKDELKVRRFVAKILKKSSPNLIECDLFQIFLAICERMEILDEIAPLEESEGSAYLLEQLRASVTNKDFVEEIRNLFNESNRDSSKKPVLLITGVGDAFPFMRVHVLLEALQPAFPNVPILVMYPGEFNGRQLVLFNELPPSDYYRAFNLF